MLIIGYGNPLRGDDGLGWHAAEALRALPGADVITTHQLTPELAEEASRTALVIFLDAAETGVPGEWRRREVVETAPTSAAFTHHVTPGSLLAAARLLYGHAPRAVLFTMTGERFDFHEGLSETVAAVLPGMLRAVREAAGCAT